LLLALLWFAVQLGANPGIWHFRFYGATPEALVKGRFAYFASFPKTATEFAISQRRSSPSRFSLWVERSRSVKRWGRKRDSWRPMSP
jgi:hypothetical protein